jgi:hypothetical protein
MSALMSTYSDPEYPPTYNYSFAIYKDSNNSIGTLIAQTAQRTAKNGKSDLFTTASFPSPVYLEPGAYWLMGVTDASPYAMISGPQTNDYNASVQCNIDGMTFPNSLPQAQPWLGHLYCIYASWELNQAGTPNQESSLFTAISNSTLSAIAYEPATSQLSFTVTGSPGTVGYSEIFISKTILPDPSGLKVTVDGKQMNYTVTAAEGFWALYFVYSHSTHDVAINMQSNIFPEFPIQLVAAFIAVTLTALLCILLLHKKRLKQSKNSDSGAQR